MFRVNCIILIKKCDEFYETVPFAVLSEICLKKVSKNVSKDLTKRKNYAIILKLSEGKAISDDSGCSII